MAVATLAAVSVARPTQAAANAGSWTNGGTIGSGTGALYAMAGFPGLSIGYLRGMSDALDAGGRFSFNYGGEGMPTSTPLGLKVAGDFKLKLDAGLPAEITVRALPGVGLFFPPGFSALSLQLPLEVALGFPAMPNLWAHVSLEVPASLWFWSGVTGVSFSSMQLPVLFGGGVELKLDQALSVTGQLHMGPFVQIFFGGLTGTQFALDALIGVTYRLQ